MLKKKRTIAALSVSDSEIKDAAATGTSPSRVPTPKSTGSEGSKPSSAKGLRAPSPDKPPPPPHVPSFHGRQGKEKSLSCAEHISATSVGDSSSTPWDALRGALSEGVLGAYTAESDSPAPAPPAHPHPSESEANLEVEISGAVSGPPTNDLTVEESEVFNDFAKEVSSSTTRSPSQRLRLPKLLSAEQIKSIANFASSGVVDGTEYMGQTEHSWHEQLRLVFGFFRAAFRIKGVAKKVALHQIAYLFIAFMTNFMHPYMYRLIILQGLENRSFKWTIFISVTMMLWQFIRYHIKLNYFHGSMLVMQNLRAALLRKYLSLGAIDHALKPNVRYEFETAIRNNVDEVRNQCWKGVFHDGLPHLYSVLMSLVFIGNDVARITKPETITLILSCAVFLLAAPIIFYLIRINRGWDIWRATSLRENLMQARQDFLLREWRTIRRAAAEMREVSNVFEAYWSYIREGLYEMWYYRFYIKERYVLALPTLLAVAPPARTPKP